MGLWCGSHANITALQFFSFSDNSDFNQATEKNHNGRSEQTIFWALQSKVTFICPIALQVFEVLQRLQLCQCERGSFFFLSLISALFLSLPLLISHSLFCQTSSTLCKAFLFTLLYPICPLGFLFLPPFHSQNSAVVEQRLNRNNICCTLPPSWSYSPLTTSLIFSCMQGLVISCGWCRVTFSFWDFKGHAHGYGACPNDVRGGSFRLKTIADG